MVRPIPPPGSRVIKYHTEHILHPPRRSRDAHSNILTSYPARSSRTTPWSSSHSPVLVGTLPHVPMGYVRRRIQEMPRPGERRTFSLSSVHTLAEGRCTSVASGGPRAGLERGEVLRLVNDFWKTSAEGLRVSRITGVTEWGYEQRERDKPWSGPRRSLVLARRSTYVQRMCQRVDGL